MTSYANDIQSQAKPFSYSGIIPKNWGSLIQPTTAPVQTNVYYPTEEELKKYAARGIVEPVKIVKISNGNGEVIKAAVNENGEVVDAEKETNPLVPLAIAAGLFFLLGG